ncbi:hypothetical protein Atai01_14690 [Amycolatopsis taiwanensis]|uniref:S-adenosyl methyltransferase n=2 Tax=Amycolatopsis taiwanensis TaxID=342230 RepID=A0A9W6VDK0_9PSEU|nr:hypothetical protein Atai01_14690 [Amycolatopsis taiwanensis]
MVGGFPKAEDDLPAVLAAHMDKPSVARTYDWYLGGTHHYAIDAEFGKQISATLPDIITFARQNRAFLRRAVRYAVDAGHTQFVDIGSGLPTAKNVHDVADQVRPGDTRVVYVDHDPVAQAHAEYLLDKHADPQRHKALFADFTEPEDLWDKVLGTGVIDPAKPVVLLAVALLHCLTPASQPQAHLDFLKDSLAPESMLIISHGWVDPDKDPVAYAKTMEVLDRYTHESTSPLYIRPPETVRQFFDGWTLQDPGLVWLPQWHPELATDDDEPFERPAHETRALAAAAVKPGA